MKLDYERSSGNVFADLGFRNSKQELLKAALTVEIYKLLKAAGRHATRGSEAAWHHAGAGVGAHALQAGVGVGRTADGVSDRARTRCEGDGQARAPSPQGGGYVGRGADRLKSNEARELNGEK
jgi:hypothetical protein